jgi:gluconate:H+ symporter, GntP family
LLFISILAVIILSAKYRWNVFFVLILVAAVTGIASGIAPLAVLSLLKTGIGSTVEKIGLLIVLGIALGLLLERSRATSSLAQAVLKITGRERSPLAMSGVGYLVGLPIFCDSGFVVLSGLANSLATHSPARRLWIVLSLATGLYAVHCLVPPHPGITTAAGALQADIGQTMLWGAIAAVLPAIVGYSLGHWFNRRWPLSLPEQVTPTNEHKTRLPAPAWALLPVLVPVALIALKSVYNLQTGGAPTLVQQVLQVLGEPVVAILVGILLCLPLFKPTHSSLNQLLDDTLSRAGGILLVTAAGGAFGEVIKAMNIGEVYGPILTQSGLGLAVPFLLAALFKTAQGSSTVAVISTAGIIAPLLPALGLDQEQARVFALLSAGAGSMSVSHANDSYFWVIAKFGHVPVEAMLRTYSIITALMGLAGLLSVWVLYQFV